MDDVLEALDGATDPLAALGHPGPTAGDPLEVLEILAQATNTGDQGEPGDPLEALEARNLLEALDASSPLAAVRAVAKAAPAVRPRRIAAKAKTLPAPPAGAPTKVRKVRQAEIDAHLGVAVALLPGRIATAHVSMPSGFRPAASTMSPSNSSSNSSSRVL